MQRSKVFCQTVFPVSASTGQEAAVVRPDVDPAICDDGRELEQAPRALLPLRGEWWADVEAGRVARALLVVPVGRPRDLADDFLRPRRRAGLLRSLELDGARAADRPWMSVLPNDVAGDGDSGAEHENERDDREDPAPSGHRRRLCSTAKSLFAPCKRSRSPLPETGTYLPCGKVQAVLPVLQFQAVVRPSRLAA